MTTLNTRLRLRTDTVERWNRFGNTVLLSGEVAVVIDRSHSSRWLMIGDGTTPVSALPRIAEQSIDLSARHLSAQSISQGLHSDGREFGLAAGANVQAAGHFSQVMGFKCESALSDCASFTWSGDVSEGLSMYRAHGVGTMNLNPTNGLSGLYIGDQKMSDILDDNKKTLVRTWN